MWNIETDTEQRVQLRGSHHMIEYNPYHNTWLTLQQSRARLWTQGNLELVMVDDIWEFDMNGTPVWKWYARAHLPHYTNLYPMNINPNKDFVHANTLHYDVHESVIYYNSRHMDTVWKIDKTSGKVCSQSADMCTAPKSTVQCTGGVCSHFGGTVRGG